MLLATTAPPIDLVACGLILRRHAGRGSGVGASRWLLLKASKHREWGFPKGHRDPGETLIETALRECAEECGIALVAIEGAPLELHYTLPSGRPKRTVYFPALTSTSEVVLSDEHVDFGWFSSGETISRLPYANLRALFKATLHAIGE
jgi:diadenosine hexaphosphate hydrolase (ATP-forming)